MFNFEKAHYILDEYLLGGEVQESSMKTVVTAIHQMDLIQEVVWVCVCVVQGRVVGYSVR